MTTKSKIKGATGFRNEELRKYAPYTKSQKSAVKRHFKQQQGNSAREPH